MARGVELPVRGLGVVWRLATMLVLVAATVLGHLAAPASAGAADTILYDQTQPASTHLRNIYPFPQAVDFVVPPGGWSIGRVDLIVASSSATFDLAFHRNGANNLPGAQVASFPGLVPVETILPGGWREAALTLPAPLILPPGTYWLAATGDFSWRYLSVPVGGTGSATRKEGTPCANWCVEHSNDASYRLHGLVPDCAALFADVAQADPACPAIYALTQAGVIQGYATAPPTFGPADGVQRAQMAAFLVRALGWGGRPTGPRTFTDFDGLVAELRDAVLVLANACDAGGNCVVRGYGDGRFGPTAPVSHAQVVALVARAFALDPAAAWVPAPPGCPAAASVPAVHAGEVCTYVANAGAIPAAPTTAEGWDAPATRGWVARVLWQALVPTP